jgi:ankyrin repeat protein
VVEILLAEPDIDVNIKNGRDWTPLRAALGTDNADAAELLAEAEWTVVVGQGDQMRQVKRLKANGTKAFHRNWNPLCHASAAGHIHVVRLLLDRPDVVGEINERDGDGMTALYLAASNGHLRVVKRLLDKGADVNGESQGFLKPLYGAALGGHTRIVQLLLTQPTIQRAPRNNEGESPLDAAVKGGHTKVADILMDALTNDPTEEDDNI